MADDSAAQVRARLQDYTDAYDSGDVTKVADLYAPDAFFVAPGQRFIRGPEGFLRAGIVQQMMDMGGKTLKFEVADMVVSSEAVSMVAMFSLFNEEGKEIDDGRVINVWVKTDGVWLLKYDMFN